MQRLPTFWPSNAKESKRMGKEEVMQRLPIFYLSDAKESKEEDGDGEGDAVQRLPIFYLSDAKQSKEEDGEGGGDAGVANLLPEWRKVEQEEDGEGGNDAGVANLLPEWREGEQGREWRRRKWCRGCQSFTWVTRRRARKRMAKAKVMQRLPIFYLSDMK
jgi:hypothetical protein